MLQSLLGIAEYDIFDLQRVDARALHQRFDAGNAQVVTSHVAKESPFGMRPSDRRPHAIHDDCRLHARPSR